MDSLRIASNSLKIALNSLKIATDSLKVVSDLRLVRQNRLISMLKSGKQLLQLDSAAYCSAPPIQGSLIPPREVEAQRPRGPLRLQEAVKAEVSSIELIKSINVDSPYLKPVIPFDPRQLDDPLQLQVAALKIEPSSSSVKDLKPQQAPGPLRFVYPWGVRGTTLCHTPDKVLGPADPPRRRGRPKGSKSRPRVEFTTVTLPERPKKLKAKKRLAVMASKK